MKKSITTTKPEKSKHTQLCSIIKDQQTVLIDPTLPGVPIRHYLNGRLASKPGNEVHQLFWQVHYGWLLPTDLYRYAIESYSKEQYVYLVVGEKSRRFGYYLHKRSDRYLTLEDLCNIENDSYITVGMMRRMSSDFNVLFEELPDDRRDLRPFKHDRGLDRPGCQCGYRMNPLRKYLVVVGIDPNFKIEKDAEIDWPRFECKPNAIAY